VLKINATAGCRSSDQPKRTPHIGDVVLAIGNPYNLGQTITQGIISATGRIGLNPTGARISCKPMPQSTTVTPAARW
jgi:serine protease DegS